MEPESRKAVEINLDDCLQNMLQQASEYLLWSQLASIADSQSEALKQHNEALAAECREKAYEKLTIQGEKTTEQRIKDAALRDPALHKHNALRTQVELFAKKLKNVQFALQQRKDMLIQVGFRQRSELGYYPKDPDLRSQADIRTHRDYEMSDLKERAMNAVDK